MPESVEAKLGRLSLRLPVRRSVEQTLQAVELVNERLRAIEEQTPVVDDLVFALLAAQTFAEELGEEQEALRQERERFEAERREDTKEFLHALGQLSGQVDGILEELSEPKDGGSRKQ